MCQLRNHERKEVGKGGYFSTFFFEKDYDPGPETLDITRTFLLTKVGLRSLTHSTFHSGNPI